MQCRAAPAPSPTSSLPTCRRVTASHSIARNCTLQHCCSLLRSHAIRLHFLHEIQSRSEVSCQFCSAENELTLNIGVTGQGFETFHCLMPLLVRLGWQGLGFCQLFFAYSGTVGSQCLTEFIGFLLLRPIDLHLSRVLSNRQGTLYSFHRATAGRVSTVTVPGYHYLAGFLYRGYGGGFPVS